MVRGQRSSKSSGLEVRRLYWADLFKNRAGEILRDSAYRKGSNTGKRWNTRKEKDKLVSSHARTGDGYDT
jgi:hypothetical protein